MPRNAGGRRRKTQNIVLLPPYTTRPGEKTYLGYLDLIQAAAADIDTAGRQAGREILLYRMFLSVLTFDEAELGWQFRRDFGDEVRGEVAADEGGVPHHVVDGIRNLDQLAAGQVWKQQQQRERERKNINTIVRYTFFRQNNSDLFISHIAS